MYYERERKFLPKTVFSRERKRETMNTSRAIFIISITRNFLAGLICRENNYCRGNGFRKRSRSGVGKKTRYRGRVRIHPTEKDSRSWHRPKGRRVSPGWKLILNRKISMFLQLEIYTRRHFIRRIPSLTIDARARTFVRRYIVFAMYLEEYVASFFPCSPHPSGSSCLHKRIFPYSYPEAGVRSGPRRVGTRL